MAEVGFGEAVGEITESEKACTKVTKVLVEVTSVVHRKRFLDLLRVWGLRLGLVRLRSPEAFGARARVRVGVDIVSEGLVCCIVRVDRVREGLVCGICGVRVKGG
jgi:hypothetical protein